MKFQIGDKVLSNTFGTGVVQSYREEDDIYEVVLDKWTLAEGAKVKVFSQSKNLSPVASADDDYVIIDDEYKVSDAVQTPYGRGHITSIEQFENGEEKIVVSLDDWCLATKGALPVHPTASLNVNSVKHLDVLPNGTRVKVSPFGEGKIASYRKQDKTYRVILDNWILAEGKRVSVYAQPLKVQKIGEHTPGAKYAVGEAVQTPYGRGHITSVVDGPNGLKYVTSLVDWCLATKDINPVHPTAYLNEATISPLQPIPNGTRVKVTPFGIGTVVDYRASDKMTKIRLDNWILAEGKPVFVYAQPLKIAKLTEADLASSADGSAQSGKDAEKQSKGNKHGLEAGNASDVKEPAQKARIEEGDASASNIFPSPRTSKGHKEPHKKASEKSSGNSPTAATSTHTQLKSVGSHTSEASTTPAEKVIVAEVENEKPKSVEEKPKPIEVPKPAEPVKSTEDIISASKAVIEQAKPKQTKVGSPKKVDKSKESIESIPSASAEVVPPPPAREVPKIVEKKQQAVVTPIPVSQPTRTEYKSLKKDEQLRATRKHEEEMKNIFKADMEQKILENKKLILEREEENKKMAEKIVERQEALVKERKQKEQQQIQERAKLIAEYEVKKREEELKMKEKQKEIEEHLMKQQQIQKKKEEDQRLKRSSTAASKPSTNANQKKR